MAEYTMRLPDVGEGVVEAEISEWQVATGDSVVEGQHIVDIQTDKVMVEITAPVTGTVSCIHAVAGDMLSVGAELIVFEVEDSTDEAASGQPKKPQAKKPEPQKPTQATEPHPANNKASEKTEKPQGRVLAAPAVRQRAKMLGIQLANVETDSADGRIRHHDLDAWLLRSQRNIKRHDRSAKRSETRGEKLTGLRRVIARNMELATSTIPHFYYTEEVDLSQLDALRADYNAKVSKPNERLNYLPFFMQILAELLPEFPDFNAHYDRETQRVEKLQEINFGIATHSDRGLKVPVLHNAENMSLAQLNEQLRGITQRARDHSSPLEELQGSTITLSSLGKLGGVVASPIINYPEVAIIVLHKASEKAVVINGKIRIRNTMNISGAFDHRVVDGHDAALLFQALRQRLENAKPSDFS